MLDPKNLTNSKQLDIPPTNPFRSFINFYSNLHSGPEENIGLIWPVQCETFFKTPNEPEWAFLF